MRKRGPDHYNWNGGRFVPGNPKEPVTVYAPEHPRANHGRVKEHILVAERALGHLLPEQARVHHWNSMRQDNQPGNLLICENQGYHMLIEVRAKRIRDTGSLDLRRCCGCKIAKPLADFDRKKKNWDGRNHYCKACKKAMR